MAWVDIHAHVLPGVDDGAATFAEALEMLAQSRAGGTERIVATPHMFAPGLGSADVEATRRAFERFRERLATAGGSDPPRDSPAAPRLDLGAENYVGDALLDAVEAGRVLTLAGSRSLLVEFWPLTTSTAARQALDRIQAAGLVPVIAHVERYGFLQETPTALEALVDGGCVAQVNGAAVLGRQGLQVAQLTDRWLRQGLIAVVASDGHDVRSRVPGLAEVHAHLEARYGADAAGICLRENPLALLSDRPVVRPPAAERFRWFPRLRRD